MKTLRHLLLTALIALCSPALADDYAYLTVTENGADNSFAVSTIDKITFTTTDMVLHLTTGEEQHLALSGLSKMFFSATGTQGIATLGTARQQMSMHDGVLTVSAPKGSRVTLYNIAGQELKSVTTREEQVQLNLSGLRKGTYIVRVGQMTQKIMHK